MFVNKQRRAECVSICEGLSQLMDRIDDVIVDEEFAASRMPDNLRQTAERKSEEASGLLVCAQDSIILAQTYIEQVVDNY